MKIAQTALDSGESRCPGVRAGPIRPKRLNSLLLSVHFNDDDHFNDHKTGKFDNVSDSVEQGGKKSL